MEDELVSTVIIALRLCVDVFSVIKNETVLLLEPDVVATLHQDLSDEMFQLVLLLIVNSPCPGSEQKGKNFWKQPMFGWFLFVSLLFVEAVFRLLLKS